MCARSFPTCKKRRLAADLLGLPQEFFDLEPLARQPLPGLHARTRAFIKAQDGCDNACTFCITTVARGASRSRPVEHILADVQSALDGGTKEIVLTGVHLGSWGQDFPTPQHLADLVSTLLARTSVPRLRLSSLEPWDLDADFFSLWQDGRLCRHLHLPLQSGSETVLKRMARKTTPGSFAALVQAARAAIPGGGHHDRCHRRLPRRDGGRVLRDAGIHQVHEFCRRACLHLLGPPGYSGGTHERIRFAHEIRKERNAILQAVFKETARSYRQQFIGRKLPVLWEATDQLSDLGWQLEGLTDNYIRVKAVAPEPRWNRLDSVELIENETDGLRGN